MTLFPGATNLRTRERPSALASAVLRGVQGRGTPGATALQVSAQGTAETEELVLEKPKRVKTKEYRRECGYCGEVFTSHSHAARYCPRPKHCREYAYRDRRTR